jgi:hypothetical protein
MLRTLFRRGPVPLFLACLVGCGDSGDTLAREGVSGTVSLDGTPLKEGSIQFLPASAQASDATMAGGAVREGKYEIPKNQGPTPGKYSVVIISGGGDSGAALPEMPGVLPKPTKEKIPAKYNLKTTLTAEVKSGQSSPIDFALTTN